MNIEIGADVGSRPSSFSLSDNRRFAVLMVNAARPGRIYAPAEPAANSPLHFSGNRTSRLLLGYLPHPLSLPLRKMEGACLHTATLIVPFTFVPPSPAPFIVVGHDVRHILSTGERRNRHPLICVKIWTCPYAEDDIHVRSVFN